MQVSAIASLLVVLVGAVLTLVVGIFLPRHRQSLNVAFCLLVLAVAAAIAGWQLGAPPGVVFHGSFAVDAPMLWTALTLMAAAAGTAVLAWPVFRGDAREAEFYTLLLFSTLGTLLMAGAHDVMEIMLGLLLTSVGSYVLVAYRRTDPAALEAVLKYYLFGALTNIGLIYGLVLLYGLSGSTVLSELATASPGPLLAIAVVLVITGVGFKAGIVPAHFWIPDVYQGTTYPVAAFLSVAPKIAGIMALTRLAAVFADTAMSWAPLIAVIAAVTMTWGNLAAFRQSDLRRLLGYSSISQTGYLLLAVVALERSALAVPGLLYYFVAYLLANLGAFAVVGAAGVFTLAAGRGLARSHPALAGAMAVALFSLVGIPPLAGFVGKYTLFAAAIESGYTWLAVVALVNSVLSLYYTLRVLAPMFLALPHDVRIIEARAQAVAVVCALLSVAVGVGAFVFLEPVGLERS